MRRYRVRLLSCAALVLLVSGKLSATHPLPGPHFLDCEARGNTVHLSWDVLGIPADGSLIAYLERDGDIIADLSPGDVSFDDVNVPEGRHVYRLVVMAADGVMAAVECEVVVGDSSGLVCRVDGTIVILEWKVPDDVLALGFVVTRDGILVATLGPDARSYREEAPRGEHVYTVSTNNVLDPNQPGGEPPDFLIGSCRVVVGTDGAVRCDVEGRIVTVQWELPAGVLALGFVVSRDGMPVATLGPDARSYREEAPLGEHVYTVSTNNLLDPDQPNGEPPDFLIGSCRVVVETAGVVECTVDGTVVTVRWDVPADISVRGFLVSRDGAIVAELGPDARSYREEAPPGEHVYTVTTNNFPAFDVLIGSCRVVVEGGFGIRCSVNANTVLIEWDELPIDVPIFGFVVRRDGQPVATLGPDATSYREPAPPGVHVYTVAALTFLVDDPLVGAGDPNANGEILIGSCRVVVDDGFGIECTVEGDVVSISWDPLPINVPILGYLVRRDGQIVAELGPDALSYREEAPPGEHVYSVVALSTVVDPAIGNGIGEGILVGTCKVLVGDPGLPPPRGLQCAVAESFPVQVQLFWENPVRYDSIMVERDNQRIAVLDGTATRFSEFDPGPGRHLYAVSGMLNGIRSPRATCVVDLGGPARNRLLLLSDALDPAGQAIPHADTVTAVLQNVDPVQAWSFGVGSDPSVLTVAEATIAGTAVAELNDGEGPTFLVLSHFETGVTMAAVIDEQNPAEILPPASSGHSLLAIRYEPGPDAVAGEAYRVSYSSELGDPPVAIVVVVDGFSVRPATSPGVVVFAPTRFLRGDGNNDGQFNMSDGVFVLDWLFRGGPQPECMEAVDANGTREINIADPVYIFQTLFIGGPPPPFPFPDCGSTSLFLGCEESACDV